MASYLHLGNGMERDRAAEGIQSVLTEKDADNIYKFLSAARTTDDKVMFKETAASSAVMGIQLNTPAWQLKVKLL